MTKHKDAVPDAPATPATPPDNGAGTSAPDTRTALDAPATPADPATLPGGANFDAENASPEDYAAHIEKLRRRKELADLTAGPAPIPVQVVDQGIVGGSHAYVPAPDDIKAVKNGETRYFTPETWRALETNGEHDGWEVQVAKPAIP